MAFLTSSTVGVTKSPGFYLNCRMSWNSTGRQKFRERHQYIAKYHRPNLFNRIWYRHQDRNRKIDFMIIGIAKCGTTWLSRRLDELPDVQRSVPKEPHFFKFRWKDKFEDWSVKRVRSTYIRRFWPHPRGKILFEASPGYLSYPLIAQRIKKYYPETKFVILLRDPVSRAYSHYNMWVRNGKLNDDFDDLVIEQLQLAQECFKSGRTRVEDYYRLGIKRPQSMISFGLYSVHLKEWFKLFPRDQFHILTTSALRDPERMARLLTFVGLDKESVNQLRLDAQTSGHQGAPMSEDARRKLQQFYEPFNADLFELLGVEQLDW